VGKGTVVKRLSQQHPEIFVSVSVTTRPPRPGEVDGVHYHFVSDAEFDALIADGALLEWAIVHGLYRYGTPQFVFLAPPSWEELIRRLVGRGTESVVQQQRRLETARAELAAQTEFDHVVVNREIGQAAEDLVALVRL
jgi:guanylate kinase